MTCAPRSARILPHKRPRSSVRSSTRYGLNMPSSEGEELMHLLPCQVVDDVCAVRVRIRVRLPGMSFTRHTAHGDVDNGLPALKLPWLQPSGRRAAARMDRGGPWLRE